MPSSLSEKVISDVPKIINKTVSHFVTPIHHIQQHVLPPTFWNIPPPSKLSVLVFQTKHQQCAVTERVTDQRHVVSRRVTSHIYQEHVTRPLFHGLVRKLFSTVATGVRTRQFGRSVFFCAGKFWFLLFNCKILDFSQGLYFLTIARGLGDLSLPYYRLYINNATSQNSGK